MPDPAAQAGSGEAALDAALARWSSDPGLAPIFAVPGAPLLVLDAAGERILHASPAALRAGIAAADGRVHAALRLGEQLRRAGAGAARLARIRFDARGIARPTACLIAAASTEAGGAVLLVAPKEPLPALRPLAASAAEPVPPSVEVPQPEPEPAQAPARPGPSGRFTWSSDAQGALTRLAGAEPDVAAVLAGAAWRSLDEAGTLDGPEFVAAIEARRTFRGLPLVLRPPGAADEIALELSGAPAARPTQPFEGFSGFGLVRDRRPRTGATGSETPEPATRLPSPEAEASERAAEAIAAPELPVSEPVAVAAVPEPGPAVVAPPVPGPAEPAPTFASTHTSPAAPDALEEASAEAVPAAPQVETAEPAPDAAPPPGHADLSTHEHAAFREIARALGARFAGDEEDPRPAEKPRGAVMAFPAPSPVTADAPHPGAAIDAAIVAALDRLPAGVLIHRERTVLFANRRFLELAGHPDREALQAASGLAPLYEGAAERAADEPVSIGTGRGGLLALFVERSGVDWDGGPAELLLVREAASGEPLRARIAQGLAQGRDDGREREARTLLDHVEEGVATLDEAGRVLALNRSAAALLSAEPREIVGGTLAELFTAEGAAAVAACLSEAREAGGSRPRAVSPLAVRPEGGTAPLRLRVVRLPAAGGPRFCAGLREQAEPHPAPGAAPPPEPAGRDVRAADILARVGREIRPPLDGILGLAEALLAEPNGQAGGERQREALREIRASGEHAVGVLDDLVHLARIEAGRIDLTFTDVALNDVISGCIAQMQPQAIRDRIVVRTSLSPDLAPLVADERLMRQAALNVIADALRYTEAGGQVIVSTTNAERGEIALRVRHTGTGMTPEEIESALEPFRPVGAGGGRGGLGLTLTKALVEANRGRFRIVSGKNEGTLVEMLFPPTRARSA